MPTPISYFDNRYYELYQSHLAKRTATEIDFITSYIQPESSVLDAACGYGRHALALAKRGHIVTGVDASEDMITLAKQSTSQQDTPAKFVQSTIESFLHTPFDASLLLFSSFGYGTENDDQNLFNALGRLTKKDGLLILDGRNHSAVTHLDLANKKTNGPETHWLAGKEWIMQHASDDGVKTQNSILLYTTDELKNMLENTGFTIQTIFSNFNKAPYTADSEKFVIVAKKD
jgi:SAM-dependent methyltransferase